MRLSGQKQRGLVKKFSNSSFETIEQPNSRDKFNTIDAVDTKPLDDTLVATSAYNFNSTINIIKHNKTSSRLMNTNSNQSVDIRLPTADVINIESRPSRETNKIYQSQKVED